MFDLPDAKRVRRQVLYASSPPRSSSSSLSPDEPYHPEAESETEVLSPPEPDPELSARLHAQLLRLYGPIEVDATAVPAAPALETPRAARRAVDVSVPHPKRGKDDEESDSGDDDDDDDDDVVPPVPAPVPEEQVFEFRLFASTSASAAAAVETGTRIKTGTQKVILEDDGDRDGGGRGVGGGGGGGGRILRPRPLSHYLTTPPSADQKAAFAAAALSAADLEHHFGRVRYTGWTTPWRVIRLSSGRDSTGSGIASLHPAGTAAMGTDQPLLPRGIDDDDDDDPRLKKKKKKKKKKVGKKRRIILRIRDRARKEGEERRARAKEEREEAEREKRTRKNRERKVKRKRKKESEKEGVGGGSGGEDVAMI